MCLPAAPLALAAAGMSAIGTGAGALSANARARFQAKVAEQNAAMEREAGRQEMENMRQASLAHYREVASVKGAQRVAAAASGLRLGFGTPADMMADVDMLADEDQRRIYQQGEQAVRGRDIQAGNYIGQVKASRQAGGAALVKGAFDFGSTVLGGAKQFRALHPGSSPA